MNLLKQVEPLLVTPSFASGYLPRRRAHHETSQLSWVKRWLKRASEAITNTAGNLLSLWSLTQPTHTVERACLSIPLTSSHVRTNPGAEQAASAVGSPQESWGSGRSPV